MTAPENPRDLPPGLLSGVVFFAIVLIGCAYIVFSKVSEFGAVYVTLVPVVIMVAYALLLGLARLFRLRDDQSGDNLYYMGFLFTLTSLAVSLYQYSSEGSAEQIVQNFGIAIASTIAGIALRIFFNQMRRDPVEVEHVARLELADASRRVRRELDSTVLEFGYFRRATQQTIKDALDEVKETLTGARQEFVAQLRDFAITSSRPIEEASTKSGATIEELSTRISKALDGLATKVAEETTQLSRSAGATVKALDTVTTKLAAMQTPEQVIDIKLNPMIQGLSRAVNAFSKNAEAQAKAVDDNIKQTHALVASVTALLSDLRKVGTAQSTPSPGSDMTSTARPQSPSTAPPDMRQQAARIEPRSNS